MSPSLVLGCVWVLAATIVAMLPMRRQYLPGMALLITAPVLVAVIWRDQGWVWGLVAFAGFLSMFRRPLAYFWRRLRGLPVEEVE